MTHALALFLLTAAAPPAATPPTVTAPRPSISPPSTPATTTASPPPKRVYVMPAKAMGVTPVQAEKVTTFVVEALVRREGYSVFTEADVRKLLSDEMLKVARACDQEGCSADVGRALNADMLMTGSLGMVGRRFVVTLSAVDVKTATVVGTANAQADTFTEVALQARKLALQVMGLDGAAEDTAFKLSGTKATSFALLDLGAADIPEAVAESLTNILATELKQVPGASVISKADVQALLTMQTQKASLGCDDSIPSASSRSARRWAWNTW